jgi:hypothetical protein
VRIVVVGIVVVGIVVVGIMVEVEVVATVVKEIE